MSKIPQQVFPLVLLFLLLLAALVTARILFVPETFGKYGHYRADAVDEIKVQQPVYAGMNSCFDCHDDIFEAKNVSLHQNVSCEVCHGPSIQHTEAPDEFSPSIPQGRSLCTLCHGYNPSRPSGFPQIISDRHNPGKPCLECHNPHNPVVPHTPEDCSACHRSIANVKLGSLHTDLECTQCHIVPDEHKNNPRFNLAQKPRDKSTCAVCHYDKNSMFPDAPHVDFDNHGDRYHCWDCHYPHSPEAVQ